MGARLFREVVRTMPSNIKPAERCLLMVLADELDNVTREGHVPREILAALCGTSDQGVKRSLQRLAALGYELRVPVGKDRDGRIQFATTGATTTYRIPVF